MNIIVCPKGYKNQIIRKNSGLLEDKFYTFEEFQDLLTLKVEKEGIYRLSKKYGIKPEIASNYIKYMRYSDLFFSNEKLDDIKEKMMYLDSLNLITRNERFRDFLKDKKVIFIGYVRSKEVEFILNTLTVLGIEYEYKRIEDKNTTGGKDSNNQEVYEFKNVVEESRFVFNSIKRLLEGEEKVNIRNIKIANYSDEYEFSFRRISKFYKIPVNFERGKGIQSTYIAKALLNALNTYNTFDEVIEFLNEKYSKSTYLKRIVNIINSYNLSAERPIDTKDIFEYEFKKVSFDQDEYEEGIDLIDITTDVINDNDHVFFIGFNLGRVPKVYQDTAYLSDEIMKELNLSTTLDLMAIDKFVTINSLNGIKNLTVSYKLQSPFGSYKPSVLIGELGYKKTKISDEFYVNESEDLINFASHMDEYEKFKTERDDFMRFVFRIMYKSYSNELNPIDPSLLKEYLNKQIVLSYSAMKEYYQCPFKYYAERILDLEKEEDKYYANLGSYAHEILEHSYDEDFDFDIEKERSLENCFKPTIRAKERFFASLMDELVSKLIEFNKEKEASSLLNKVDTEKNLNIILENGALKFTGKIDKLIENVDDAIEYMAIVDYKTGSDEMKLENLEDGMNLQLPVYVYLINKSGEFKNPEIIGAYLQKINIGDEEFRLQGYTKCDTELLKKLDPMYSESTYIKSMKTKKDGNFYDYVKLFDKEDEEQIIEAVDKLIIDCYNNIRCGNFDIAPKKISGNDVSCGYCKFKDICYKTYNDYKEIKKKPFLKD